MINDCLVILSIDPGIMLLIVFLVLVLSVGVPLIVIFAIRSKYKKFVLNHNDGIKTLESINHDYEHKFNYIPNCDMQHSYDNENFYDNISCADYLTYQLVYDKKMVVKAMDDTLANKVMFEYYRKKVEEECDLTKYDTIELPKNSKLLSKFEDKIFKELFLKPTINFSIVVRLELTKINGVYLCGKEEEFKPSFIRDTITRINRKNGSFYLDEGIWNSICRVERGKVTNKMRFAIYERDNYRCRKCGRRTNDLEVDHIIPIAKGGKSTYNNLQTLCHKCNTRKGANIEY